MQRQFSVQATLMTRPGVPQALADAYTGHQGDLAERLMAALEAGERAVAYCASKGGLQLLTRAMARDHARNGVRFDAICPGGVDTPMLAAEAEEQGMEIDDFLAMVAQSSPNGRIAAPEDVAALVLFLASDAASHITGTNIPCDGGVMA